MPLVAMWAPVISTQQKSSSFTCFTKNLNQLGMLSIFIHGSWVNVKLFNCSMRCICLDALAFVFYPLVRSGIFINLSPACLSWWKHTAGLWNVVINIFTLLIFSLLFRENCNCCCTVFCSLCEWQLWYNEMVSVSVGLLGLDGFRLNANCFDPRSFGEFSFGLRWGDGWVRALRVQGD